MVTPHARGTGTRRPIGRDRSGKLLIPPPRTDVTVRFTLPPDLHALLVWAARRRELPVETYLHDLVEDDLVQELEHWDAVQADQGRAHT